MKNLNETTDYEIKPPRRIIKSDNADILVGGRPYLVDGLEKQAAARIIDGDIDTALNQIQELERSFGLKK